MSKFKEGIEKIQPVKVATRIEDGLDKESYEDFKQALSNPQISAASIQRVLKSLGVNVSVMSIQRMRHE